MKAKATTGTAGSFTQIPEYELNLDISLALQTELENRGYRVVMTRTDNDTAISNAERAVKAYEEGGDIYVRIHANGSEDSSVSGALGMTPSYDNAYVGHLAEESYRLTDCILSAYCQETGFGDLGIQYHDDMTGINWSQIPVTILEMGFMTNEHDDTAMADEAMRQKMVMGIANGVDQYFGR
jgi:N-acetylmuramoyl-L-alanine amidase